ncbi:MAG TPA: type II CAAX endopeptidase family protein [Anaerolineales bacterium]|nr:type II CAAX endopeptidase family protein [Anaerolineales bacterium]
MNAQKKSRLWWTLLAAPILALVLIVLASVYFGIITQGKDPAAIPQLVANSTPYQLVALQIWLLLVLLKSMKREGLSWKDIGWKLQDSQQLWREILIGAIPGVVIALLYFFVLSPVLVSLQKIWDYVPAGSVLTALGASLIPFAVADVLFAPFVEESIYRGYGLTHLLGKFSQPAAVALSVFFFGILHWTGGFWYIVLVGLVAGVPFAYLRIARKNIIAPFAAHLALNLIETIFIIIGIGA